MVKIIIIEDEESIREELEILLGNAGYEINAVTAFNEISEEVKKYLPDLILLDINLPGKNGYEICKDIRKFSAVPIIFVTSQNTSMDELKALTLGGDDFISKPYNLPVLLARIQTVLRRNQPKDEQKEIISCKNIFLDLSIGTLTHNGEIVDLTKNELKILYYLFKHEGSFVSRADIIDFLWDNEVYIDDNTLSVNVTRIREKLKQIGIRDLIMTKRGMGYRV